MAGSGIPKAHDLERRDVATCIASGFNMNSFLKVFEWVVWEETFNVFKFVGVTVDGTVLLAVFGAHTIQGNK